MARPIRHRPRVLAGQVENTPEGEAWVWRIRCACNTTAHTPYYRRSDAEAGLRAHLDQVTPPPQKRCREPKNHRCQVHDHCVLCADQLPLPGMEEPAHLALLWRSI